MHIFVSISLSSPPSRFLASFSIKETVPSIYLTTHSLPFQILDRWLSSAPQIISFPSIKTFLRTWPLFHGVALKRRTLMSQPFKPHWWFHFPKLIAYELLDNFDPLTLLNPRSFHDFKCSHSCPFPFLLFFVFYFNHLKPCGCYIYHLL
jgi:hypothetical protein